MKWSILCLTQKGRERFLARLAGVLRPQLEEYPDVEFTIRKFDPLFDLGNNRQMMMNDSSAEYISQVDDDDLVPADYVSTIYPLLDGIDYVGFRLQLYIDGEKQKPTYHSLRYKEWNADQQGFYRDISHLNPIRRELAIQAPMSGGGGEDQRWADAIRRLGIVKTEHYCGDDKVMYYYLFRNRKTEFSAAPVHTFYPEVFSTRQPTMVCPKCNSTSCAMAGGLRHCNQCGANWD